MTEFHIRLRKRNIPEEELVADMQRVAGELSKNTITELEYTENGNFGVTTFLRRFKKWNVALERAGLEAPNRQHVPETELFENIANVWTGLGHQPFGRDLDKVRGQSRFALGTYENRFGSWNKALIAFATFIKSGKVSESPPPVLETSRRSRRTRRKINWRLRAQGLIRNNCICQMCGTSPARIQM